MGMEIEGELFAAQSGANTACRLLIENQKVYILREKDKLYACELSDLKIDPPLGSVRRKIKLPDGSVFESNDLEAVDDLNPSKFWSRLSKTEKTGWHIIPIAIATPFMAFGLYRLIIPLLIAFGMALTPDEALYSIDKTSLASIDKIILDESEISHARRVEIQKIFENLLDARSKIPGDALSDRTYKYSINFRGADAVGPNAFALPGGSIIVTDELLLKFPDDHVIAAILAHEIGHVENQHSLRQLFRAVGAASLVSMIAGDAGPLLEDAILEGSALLSLSYSRKHETQSDDYSYELLKAANMRRDGLIGFFNGIENFNKTTTPKNAEDSIKIDDPDVDEDEETDKRSIDDLFEWMSSHPVSEKRVQNIRDKLKSDGIPYEDDGEPEN